MKGPRRRSETPARFDAGVPGADREYHSGSVPGDTVKPKQDSISNADLIVDRLYSLHAPHGALHLSLLAFVLNYTG